MTTEIEFCLLGPVTVRVGGAVMPVAAGKQRAVLAALLLDANRLVSLDDLIEVLWEDAPPPSARVTVRNYVMRLRKALGPVAGSRVSTAPSGYLIRVDVGELDTAMFEAHLNAARRAVKEGAWQAVASAARAGLALWHGEPLAAVESGLLAMREVPRLGELRLEALEARIRADLELDQHATVVAELRQLVRGYPVRENLHGLLMLALYRDGRQAEALAVYQDARQVLVDTLGIEPGARLRDLHQRILSGDSALAGAGASQGRAAAASTSAAADAAAEAGRPAPAAPDHRPAVPRGLPPAVPGFTARAAELATLTQILDQAAGEPGTVVISAIGGTAGVGKTALALHWAHLVAGRFRDGQLHANLRGFDPAGAPATPAEVVRGFLDALGVPPERIPPNPDAQASLYRGLLADRTMLIVLDNARDEQQVRPMLPASPASIVLVTSRNQLPGLAAADGARLINLDVLRHGEAVQLLASRIGTYRAAAEPAAVSEIAVLCARLPLALAVAAARAAARPRFPMADLAAELRDETRRLDALDAGDPAVSVAAVFSWSYSQLGEAAARMFRLLGLHPGPDISVPAAASLAAITAQEARGLLRELARGCLITEHVPGRYAFHDLLRAYAAARARDIEPQPEQYAATIRVLDHYLHTANHNTKLLSPSSAQLALPPPSSGTRPERPADHRAALAWYLAEHQVLLAAVALAAETGSDVHTWQLPCAMNQHLLRRGYPQERVTFMSSAVAAATRLDDALGQAASLHALGSGCADAGDYDQARVHLERCLVLYQRLGDRIGEAWAQQYLSVLAEVQGRYAGALGHSEKALLLFRASGHGLGEARVLADVAWSHALLGDYESARAFCEQSLALIEKLGGCNFEFHAWDTLGYAELHLGDFAQAAVHFEIALGLCRDYGFRHVEAEILVHVGDARHAAGELEQARQVWQQALTIFEEIHSLRDGEVRAKLASTGRLIARPAVPGPLTATTGQGPLARNRPWRLTW